MTCKKSPRCHILALALLVPGITLTDLSAQATPASRATIVPPYQISLNFKVPKRGAPSSTAGGASRGSCSKKLTDKPALTSLMPSTRLGLTFAKHPSFFVYIPQSSAKAAGFLLLSEDDTEIVYETTFALPSTGGIVRFDLPPTAPELQVGKQYHWYVTTFCDATSGLSGSPSVEGWIERSTPDAALTAALRKTLPDNRPAVYAEAGIWHETLATLSDLRQQSPKNDKFLKDWRELLRSVGLEAVAAAPLVTASVVKP